MINYVNLGGRQYASGNSKCRRQTAGRFPPGSRPRFGDSLERTVFWKTRNDLSSLAGRPVRFRMVLKDADLYSLQFK